MKSNLYESPEFNQVLDEVLHPGGLDLSARLAQAARINPGSLVLDIASGRGTTACFLAKQHNCHVIGMDLSVLTASLAGKKVKTEALSQKIGFAAADAEHLPFADSSFDVVISECSFSLFPHKDSAAKEIARVLKPGGRLAITDVFLKNPLSRDLKTRALFDCCFSGAETLEAYKEIFENAGLAEHIVEDHSVELKKITYKLVTGYGSVSAFWEQFGKGALSCRAPGAGCNSSVKLWKRVFAEGKPGYALLSFTNIAL